mgnify:CR=1 FL=1
MTWDEPEVDRKALSTWANKGGNKDKGANDMHRNDLRTYLASASDDSSVDEWDDGEWEVQEQEREAEKEEQKKQQQAQKQQQQACILRVIRSF